MDIKTYDCKFQREFTIQIHAPDVKVAKVLADEVLAGFPKGSCKILSLLPEGYVEPVESVTGDEKSKSEIATLVRNEGLAKKVGTLLPDPGTDAA